MAFVLVLLYAPGLLVALMLRLPPVPALAVAPAMSIAIVTGVGWVLGLTSLRWNPGVSLLLVGVPVVAAALIMALFPAIRRPWQDAVEGGSRQLWFAVGAVCAAASLITVITVAAMGDPAAIPQQPDTIFHLGVVASMHDSGILSATGAQDFLGFSPTGYPLGFHVVAAAAMSAAGSTTTVACTAVALVAAAAVWPIGLSALGAVMAPGTSMSFTAPLAGVLFAALPFFPMGYGVLWPFMVGFVLVPGVMVLVHAASWQGDVSTARLPTIFATVGGFLGLYLAHPSAVLGALIYSGLVGGVALGVGAVRSRTRGIGLFAAFMVALLPVVVIAALTRPGMFASGPLGPDISWASAVLDAASGAPMEAAPAWFAIIFVVLGIARPRGSWPCLGWVWIAVLGASGAYILNVANDSLFVRLLTWPWYNNPVRVAVMTSLPLVLLAAWGMTGLASRASRRRERASAVVAVCVLSAGVVVVGLDARARHVALLRPYYSPAADRWWITSGEAEDLRRLAAEVPQGAKVVANPWLGSSFLYPMSGTRMYFPTEKQRWTEQERIVADMAHAATLGSEVCAALGEAGVRFAIVGGDAPVYGRDQSEHDFRGVASIPDSDYWELQRTAGQYRLFRLTGC
jgi:hypothetical protein